MILDISDATFKNVLNDKELYLPIRWNGSNFVATLDNLFNHYIKQIELLHSERGNLYNPIQANVKDMLHTPHLCSIVVKHCLNRTGHRARSTTCTMNFLRAAKKNIPLCTAILDLKKSLNGYAIV